MALQRACVVVALLVLAFVAVACAQQRTPAASFSPTRCWFKGGTALSLTFTTVYATTDKTGGWPLMASLYGSTLPADGAISTTLFGVRDTKPYLVDYCLNKTTTTASPPPALFTTNTTCFSGSPTTGDATTTLVVGNAATATKVGNAVPCPGGTPASYNMFMSVYVYDGGADTYTGVAYLIPRTGGSSSTPTKLVTTRMDLASQMVTPGSTITFATLTGALAGDAIGTTQNPTTCPSSTPTTTLAIGTNSGTATMPSNYDGSSGSWSICAYGVVSATDTTLQMSSGQVVGSVVPVRIATVSPIRGLPPLSISLTLTESGSTTTASDRYAVLASGGNCAAATGLSTVTAASGAVVTVSVPATVAQGAAYTLCYALPTSVGGNAVSIARNGAAPTYATTAAANDFVFVPGLTGITPTRVGPTTVITLQGRYLATGDQGQLGGSGSPIALTSVASDGTSAQLTPGTLPSTAQADVYLRVSSVLSTPLSNAATIVSLGTAFSPSRIAFGQTVTLTAGGTGQLGQGAVADGDSITWVQTGTTCAAPGADKQSVQLADGSTSAVKAVVTSSVGAVQAATVLKGCYSVGTAIGAAVSGTLQVAQPGTLATQAIRRAAKSPLLITGGSNLLAAADQLLLDVDSGCPTPDVPATTSEASPTGTSLYALVDTSALATNTTLRACLQVNGQGPTPTAAGTLVVMPVTGVQPTRVPATGTPSVTLTVLGAGLQGSDSFTVRPGTAQQQCTGTPVTVTVGTPTIAGGGTQATTTFATPSAARYEVCYLATGFGSAVGLADSLYSVSATGFSPSRIIASAALSLTVSGTQVSSAGDRVGFVAAADCSSVATPYSGLDEESGATTVFLPTAPADPVELYSLCYAVGSGANQFAPQLVGTAESIEVVRLDSFSPARLTASQAVTITVDGVNLDGSVDVLALHSFVDGVADCSAATRVYPAADQLPLAGTPITDAQVTFAVNVPLSANYTICYGVDNGTVWAPVAAGRLFVSCDGDAQCNDSVYCNGVETCNTAAGECVAGTAVDCAPATPEPCIAYLCNETGQSCYQQPSCVCGDGIVQDGEGCDTGDAFSQGCLNCTVTSGWRCSGEPSLCRLRSSATALVLSLPVAIVLLLAALLL